MLGPITRHSTKVAAKPVTPITPAEDDPVQAPFTVADATRDLKGKGPLVADLDVEITPVKGSVEKKSVALSCQLFDDRAPLTVATFAGLALGTRPWKGPEGKWLRKPAYDGTTFHRIVRGFMIQGGDPTGTGTGQPGFVVPDEIWEDAYHDRAGLLCMANRGPDTNGAQFFITDGPAPHLDGRYTIFGECGPVEAIKRISSVDVKGERPVHPPRIRRVTIKRAPAPPAEVASPAAR